MFEDETFKKYKIDENNSSVGEIAVNEELIHNSKFYYPFVRDNLRKEIIKVGNRDYEALNKYIIASMNDYYNRLMNATDADQDLLLNNYNRLYSMWRELYNYKKSGNLIEMDKIYDLFSYELYVLGYTE